ncbi:hypothetical protein K502DRAFT_130400 [Neoconidiobolus thromboides FSU 785]|nr:hypothetical protein K502DRAFT_130400 [Neoconidiobolus thromboides FSU 785]
MIHENELNLLLNNEFHLGLSKELQDRRSKWYTYPIVDLFSVFFLPKALLGDKKYTFNPKLLGKDSMLSKIMKFKLGYGKDIENSHYFSDLEAPSSNGFTNSNSVSYSYLLF